MREIDFSQFQVGDILATRGAGIGDAIAVGESALHELHNGDPLDAVEDAVEAVFDPSVPSHFLYVYDPDTHEGAEMTVPHIATVRLDQFGTTGPGNHICAAFRCPWLDDRHNADAWNLRDKLHEWMTTELKKATPYGFMNYPAFLGLTEQDYAHAVCSIWVMNGIIQIVNNVFPCQIPVEWLIDKHNCCGLVSPLDLGEWLNAVGWGIPYTKQ